MEEEVKQKILVGVFGATLNNEGKILMTRRHSPDRLEWHNKWQFPGGGMEYGETSEETLKRELMEELMINIEILHPQPVVVTHIWNGVVNTEHAINSQIVLLTYLTKIVGTYKIDFEDDPETNGFGWFTREEISQLDCLPKVEVTVSQIWDIIEKGNYA